MHYQRVRRHNDPAGDVPSRLEMSPHDLFWSKVNKCGPMGYHWQTREQLGPCWEWTAGTNSHGYGVFGVEGGSRLAYNIAHEWLVGSIEKGMERDHLCRWRLCVNPAHIEVVTHSENVRRGLCGALRPTPTHCKNGHAMTPENTYVHDGWRICRSCQRAAKQRYRDRQAAAVNAAG